MTELAVAIRLQALYQSRPFATRVQVLAWVYPVWILRVRAC